MTAPVRALATQARRALKCLAVPLLVLLAATGTALACVPGAEPTTLSTSLSGESKSGESITVLEGTKVKDQATLSGKNAAKATGKISYAVYKDSLCKELATKAGESEFKEGKVPASEEKTLEAGKTYYWQAHYGGDSLDAESTSSCGKEVLSVKAATSVSTSLSGESKSGESITVLEGTKVKDKATLAGTNSGTATGKVKFKVYKDSECKELATTAGEPSVSGGSAESEEKTLEAGRTYYWQASYEGDSLHSESTSSCKEVLSVEAATSISTSLSGESKSGESITVLEGTKVKDKATLAGTNSGTATGKIEFKVYKDPECKELATSAGEPSVSGGSAESEEKTLEAGKAFYWRAHYKGDSLHGESTSSCGEKASVQATTGISTSLSGEEESGEEITVLEGAKVKDKATLSGTNSGTATGEIEFKVYEDPECKELAASAGKPSVSGGSAESAEETLEGGKTYYWQATYKGDGLHQSAVSPCSEKASVEAATSLETSLSGEGQSGEEIEIEDEEGAHDTATLSGTNASTATGNVKYTVYADAECDELAASAGEVSVAGGSVPDSSEEVLPAGFYYWQAEYSGDATHQPASSPCVSEVEVVAVATQLETTLTSQSGSGEEVEVEEGEAVADTAVLKGANASEATGSVAYGVFADSECKELVLAAGGGELSGGEPESSSPVVLPAGTYYWQATFKSGDFLNKDAVSECGTEIEVVEPQPLTTTLSGEGQTEPEITVDPGAPVTDTATLNMASSSTATGTVEYAVYADSKCEELEASAGEVSVESGVAAPSKEVALPLGVYYWQATYSGDESHEAASSECASEVEVVAAGTSLTTSLQSEVESGAEIEVEEGVPVADTAELTGENAEAASGTVEYRVYSDPECKNLVKAAGSPGFEGGGIPDSDEVELDAGVYYWQANYFGDAGNQPATSSCGDEVEVVRKAALTSELFGNGEEGDYLELEEGKSVVDLATLNEENAKTATGTVEYRVYSDGECTELETKAGKVTVAGGEISPSEGEALAEGTYYWRAFYSGDETHEEAATRCQEVAQKVVIEAPWVISVGDSYIAGEGGRWAGNVDENKKAPAIEALGPYEAGLGESSSKCHRSPETAEINFLYATANSAVIDKNFACSGARTYSFVNSSVWSGNEFKPGLDFLEVGKNELLDKSNPDLGRCPLSTCRGQARELELFAAEKHASGEKIKMVAVSIGGNNFGFADVVKACVLDFIKHVECGKDPKQTAHFEGLAPADRRNEIEMGLVAVGTAMEHAGYEKSEYTILVQDYPSPIPKASGIRYGTLDEERIKTGGCAVTNGDADWANEVALTTINDAVEEAVDSVDEGGAGKYKLKFMDLEKTFVGRRLCEDGQKQVAEGADPEFPTWRATAPDGTLAVDGTEWFNQIRFPNLTAPWTVQEDLHPNYWAQLGLRNCLRQAYNGGAVKSGKCAIEAEGLTDPPSPKAPLTWRREPKMKLLPP